eukprot:m.260226 g.260226  ORF g.260226 m.260226 type:complete len:61 (+) comp19677_c0_seq2:2041-2223(+)
MGAGVHAFCSTSMCKLFDEGAGWSVYSWHTTCACRVACNDSSATRSPRYTQHEMINEIIL